MNRPSTALRVALAGLVAVAAMPSQAQEIGTAGAVNPATTGTPPNRPTRTLELGSRVVFRERVTTSAVGTAQIIFTDKSTLSLGPNSAVVIDEYVYDPSTGSGRMAATLTKGLLRFVGGATSHTGGAQITTPGCHNRDSRRRWDRQPRRSERQSDRRHLGCAPFWQDERQFAMRRIALAMASTINDLRLWPTRHQPARLRRHSGGSGRSAHASRPGEHGSDGLHQHAADE
jgi:hypothetical protein